MPTPAASSPIDSADSAWLLTPGFHELVRSEPRGQIAKDRTKRMGSPSYIAAEKLERKVEELYQRVQLPPEWAKRLRSSMEAWPPAPNHWPHRAIESSRSALCGGGAKADSGRRAATRCGRRGLSSLVPSTALNSVIGLRGAQAAGNNRNATRLGCEGWMVPASGRH